VTAPFGPVFLAQIALSFGGELESCRADEDDYDNEGRPTPAVEGMHHLEITFPNLWEAMKFHQFVMRPQVVGFPPQAREVDLLEPEKVTKVAQPVTLRVVSNPEYAEAIFTSHFGAKA
jgi:hypothetical protein